MGKRETRIEASRARIDKSVESFFLQALGRIQGDVDDEDSVEGPAGDLAAVASRDSAHRRDAETMRHAVVLGRQGLAVEKMDLLLIGVFLMDKDQPHLFLDGEGNRPPCRIVHLGKGFHGIVKEVHEKRIDVGRAHEGKALSVGHDGDVDLQRIARATPGSSGADLANLVNEAALLSARRDKEKLGMPEFEEAIDRVMAGPERKSRVISEKEREIIAYHEAGHALVAAKIKGTDPVHKISIIPRGHMALGYTLQLPEEDRFLVSKQELSDRICVLLGGRVAEMIRYGDVTTGASNDLERATQIARQMVTQFGMSDKLGLVTLGRKQHEVFLGHDIVDDRNYSEEVAHTIDLEIRAIIDSCMNKAQEILTENRERLEEITQRLLKEEVLEGDELDELLGYPKKEHHAEGDKEKNAAAEDGEASKEENGGGSSSESGDEVVRELPDIEQVDEKTLNAPMDENK